MKGFKKEIEFIINEVKNGNDEKAARRINTLLDIVYSEGVKSATPYIAVDTRNDEEIPLCAGDYDVNDEEIMGAFLVEVLYPEIKDMLFNYYSLDNYETYEDFVKDNPSVERELDEIQEYLYPYNRYTGEAIEYDFNFDKYVKDNWKSLRNSYVDLMHTIYEQQKISPNNKQK